jgi:hypothetical protein
MAARFESMDVDAMPEVLRLAKDVAAGGRPRSLLLDGKEIAVLLPVTPRPRRRVPTEKEAEAFRAAAGSWRDVDTDRLLTDIYTSRDAPPAPPVDL